MAYDDIVYERPAVHSEDKPVLYRADGTPLKRQIGFCMQPSTIFPALNTKSPKKKGKKR